MKLFKIFLSSPGDCNDERNAVHQLVARLNADPLVEALTHIEVVAWDWGAGVPLDALHSPQGSVNEHMPTPEVCDLFIGIFRCRFGTPLPRDEFRKIDGTPYLSGSEYEFHRAWQVRRLGQGHPRIQIYRWEINDASCCNDHEQLQRLKSFFEAPPFHDGTNWTGSLHSFQDTDNFIKQVENHIKRFLSQLSPGLTPPLSTWCRHQAEKLTQLAGPRYTSQAHIETSVGKVFDWLLIRQGAIEELDDGLKKVWERLPTEQAFEDVKGALGKVAEGLRNDTLWHKLPDFNSLIQLLKKIETLAWSEYEKLRDSEPKGSTSEKLNHLKWTLQEASSNTHTVTHLIQTYSTLATKRVLVLTGPAGQGKTHSLVHEVHRTLKLGGLAIGILGQQLSGSGTLWEEIRQCLDYSETISNFLDTLESEAAQLNQRVLIVIDALNETNHRERWARQLPGMLHDILRHPHLAVTLSIRFDYLSFVLPQIPEETETPWVIKGHPGFVGMEPDALIKYFAHFGVKAPIAPPVGELGNPLYVQLLAKSIQGQDELLHWRPSWLDVWNTWIDRLEKDAAEKQILNDPSRKKPIRRTLIKLAQTMLESGSFTLSRENADDIARRICGVDNVIAFLCSAGALTDWVENNHEEIIDFAYERLSDTFLADTLITDLFKGLVTAEAKREAFTTATLQDGKLYPLIDPEWGESPLYYRRTGLLRAFCLTVPRQIGCELPGLFAGRKNKICGELSDAFTDSLRWRNSSEEFAATPKELWEFWQTWSGKRIEYVEIDEILTFSLIPEHPFAMGKLLHPWLLTQESPGARDACWTIHLIPLYQNDDSTLNLLMRWAVEANLEGLRSEIALPVAQILAWFSATSHPGMREKAIQGLTRVVTACPKIVQDFLPDFLSANDAYVVEAVLIAIWGMVIDDHSRDAATFVAQRILHDIFPRGSTRWCHVTIRHYARKIVERVFERGCLPGLDVNIVRPPYQSTLLLSEVPDKAGIKALNDSLGFGRIVHSATDWDFFRYVMGGNWGSAPFSSIPKATTREVPRPYIVSERDIPTPAKQSSFDLALAGRFVAWNCLNLGWTSERFNNFDTGHYTEEYGRISHHGRTERIGKKYQWISWFTMLAFMADNFEMIGDGNGETIEYDSPAQLSYIDLYDPSRWINSTSTQHRSEEKTDFWALPNLPKWPLPKPDSIKAWGESLSHDLPPTDIISWIPELPKEWSNGPWIRVAAEHIWEESFAPGQWGVNKKFHADIWWQISPRLILNSDFPNLLELLGEPEFLKHFREIGRVDLPCARDTELPAWSVLEGAFAEGFIDTSDSHWRDWFPVPWMHFVGECGDSDRRDSHGPVVMPWPRLIREWQLELDLRRGVMHKNGEIIFGLAGWILGKDALMARLDPLQRLLMESGYKLIWLLRGERRVFLNLSLPHDDPSSWVDLYGLAYLGMYGHVQTAWLDRTLKLRQI
ncbi:hypothetical protein F6V25_01605 [Oryzomonas japonica]|uniref:DUF4062 domain-containing protein n=1 Tax=Oryzomonas japonica TaxID=2603858 RepID=A0A7J4ZV09_9BACT|nr:hypothetical protein [Oryzomonas japonica]KAB0667424.1 hypothetical protein F6V25_01605 [Oryzomonas japonica]